MIVPFLILLWLGLGCLSAYVQYKVDPYINPPSAWATWAIVGPLGAIFGFFWWLDDLWEERRRKKRIDSAPRGR